MLDKGSQFFLCILSKRLLHRPYRKHERHFLPIIPFLSEVEYKLESLQPRFVPSQGFIADEEHGIERRVIVHTGMQALKQYLHTVLFFQQDLEQADGSCRLVGDPDQLAFEIAPSVI